MRLVEADAIGGRLLFRVEEEGRPARGSSAAAGEVDRQAAAIYHRSAQLLDLGRDWRSPTFLPRGFLGYARWRCRCARPLCSLPASLVVISLALAGCTEIQPMPVDPAGRLFARGLDQIDELYIVRVSNRILALGAADRLSQLDPKLRLTETPGPHDRNRTRPQLWKSRDRRLTQARRPTIRMSGPAC